MQRSVPRARLGAGRRAAVEEQPHDGAVAVLCREMKRLESCVCDSGM